MTSAGGNTTIAEKKGLLKPGEIIALVCLVVAFLDQISKLAVVELLSLHEDRVIIDGFFKLVYWGNTGAAWSLFRDKNRILAVLSLIAFFFLIAIRNKFETKTLMGQVAMGMIFGGIVGNITDRIIRGHVVDFLYFYIIQRSGNEIGFPAFNIADLCICIGVAIMVFLIVSKKKEGEIPVVQCLNVQVETQSENSVEYNAGKIDREGIPDTPSTEISPENQNGKN